MGITTPHIIFHPSSNKSKYNFSLHDAKVTKHKSIYRKKKILCYFMTYPPLFYLLLSYTLKLHDC